MSKAVRDLFSSIAPKYDFLNHFMSLSIDRKWRDQCIQALEPGCYGRILDLCAGTLDLTEQLAARYPETSIVSLDFSLAMLKVGEKKIKGKKNAQLVCGDGHHFPFPEDSFDAMVCAFGIRNLEKRKQAGQEIRRVLKPGGKLVVLEFFRPEKIFPKLFYGTYGKHVIPRIGGLFSKNREAYQYLQDSITKFLSVEEYQELLKSLGFKNFDIFPLSGGIAHRVVAE